MSHEARNERQSWEREVLQEMFRGEAWLIAKRRLLALLNEECMTIGIDSRMTLEEVRNRQGRIGLLRQMIDKPLDLLGEG